LELKMDPGHRITAGTSLVQDGGCGGGDVLLHNQREGVARLAKCLTGAGWHRHPATGKRTERQVEQSVQVCLSVTPGERPGLEVQLVRTPGLLGMWVQLADANHRGIPAHHPGS